ncbi:Uncharacterised protein [Shewanella baltica]|nr:Uncharacterised protein [Shewanella baltica]
MPANKLAFFMVTFDGKKHLAHEITANARSVNEYPR